MSGIATIAAAIFKHTKQHFSFHLFRHSAATFISETTPERTRMTSGVLHHARLSTANKYYIKGQKRRAHLKFHSAVRDIAAKERHRSSRSAKPKKKDTSGG